MMACNHERIKTVNCAVFCDICGAELPAEYLTGKRPGKPADAANAPENGEKKPVRKRKA